MEALRNFAGGVWRRFRSWPIVVQIIVGFFMGLFTLSAAAAPFVEEPKEEPVAVEDELPRATTTERRRTTTTEERTTTTAEPTTTTTAAPTTTTTTTTAPPPPPTTAQPPPPPPPSNCDSNYSGCVPIASDVDCAGGSGNGPEYVAGPVTVTGSDIYGLDADGDGQGCED